MANDAAGFQRRQRELARQERAAEKRKRREERRLAKRAANAFENQMSQQPPMLGGVARIVGEIP